MTEWNPGFSFDVAEPEAPFQAPWDLSGMIWCSASSDSGLQNVLIYSFDLAQADQLKRGHFNLVSDWLTWL